jgi:hypothetical protein
MAKPALRRASSSGQLSERKDFPLCTVSWCGRSESNRHSFWERHFESTCPTQSNKSGSTKPDGRRPGPHLIMDFPCSVRRSRMRRSSESKGSVRKREKVA